VIEDERRRLMRDMHDGVGSQLVQTLNLVRMQRGQLDPVRLETMIHHALEELRMTLDSLEPMEGDLPPCWAPCAGASNRRLRRPAFELDWQVQDVPPAAGLDSQGVLHLFRCLQEVFANVVKHAQATQSRCAPGTRTASHLEVVDNGVGMTDPGPVQSAGAWAVQPAGARRPDGVQACASTTPTLGRGRVLLSLSTSRNPE
jgi:signal transduction histidine kinase